MNAVAKLLLIVALHVQAASAVPVYAHEFELPQLSPIELEPLEFFPWCLLLEKELSPEEMKSIQAQIEKSSTRQSAGIHCGVSFSQSLRRSRGFRGLSYDFTRRFNEPPRSVTLYDYDGLDPELFEVEGPGFVYRLRGGKFVRETVQEKTPVKGGKKQQVEQP